MEPRPVENHSSSIMIVDDDPHGLRVLHGILDGVAEIAFAKSGEDALEQIARQMPDLVLLDGDMPGMGGYATCASLKANPETTDLPVVFVTAYADTDSETRALALGAADFIHKPVNPPVVLARVKTQLALKQKTDELRRLTSLDPLTGIANRRAFDEALAREWRRALRSNEPLSLLLIDVDHFKRYNDTYGHPAGDVCLRQVAQALADSTQRAGDIAARYGGEEFAVILPHTQPVDAQAFAERLCAKVRDLGIPHRESLTAQVVTMSIGLASMYPPCELTSIGSGQCHTCSLMPGCAGGAEMLLKLADHALYVAKNQGRDRVVRLASTPDPTMLEEPQ